MFTVILPEPTEEHNFYIPTTPDVVGKTIATAVKGCAPVLGEEPHEKEVCTLASSIICGFLPGLVRQVDEVFKCLGIKLRKIRLPSEAEQHGVEMATEATQISYAFIFFAQVVLLLFKNVNERDYDDFIARHLTDLKEIIGLPTTVDTRDLRAFALTQATEIRQCLGALDKFRVLTLKGLIHWQEKYPDTPFGKVSSYCLGIISWSEMSPFVVIYNELVVTSSPVLTNRDVIAEVVRLADAFKCICASKYPQFFRIMADPIGKELCKRSNFPALVAVAQELCRRTNNPQVSRFVSSSPLVTRLVNLHLASRNPPTNSRAVQALDILHRTRLSNPPAIPVLEYFTSEGRH